MTLVTPADLLLIIAALGVVIVNIIVALRSTAAVAEIRREQINTATSLFAVAKDTAAIKGHVNSEKTASDGREAALRQENTLLREMLADKKATAGLLAQAVAQTNVAAATLMTPASTLPPPDPPLTLVKGA